MSPKELLGLLSTQRHAKVPYPPWSTIASCYRLFCRVVVTLTSVSDREIRVDGADHRQAFYYGIIAPVNLPYNPLGSGSKHLRFTGLLLVYPKPVDPQSRLRLD
jgi:hypothetical protein